MNYLILGEQIYTPNACPVQNYDGCDENGGCYKYTPPCDSNGGSGSCPKANVHQPD